LLEENLHAFVENRLAGINLIGAINGSKAVEHVAL
jgi:hypothetical protein